MLFSRQLRRARPGYSLVSGAPPRIRTENHGILRTVALPISVEGPQYCVHGQLVSPEGFEPTRAGLGNLLPLHRRGHYDVCSTAS